MLACKTEVASAAWRDGLIEGLAYGLALAVDEDLRGKALQHAVIRQFNQLTPGGYHRYVQAYLHQGELYGVSAKMLSFWQWRYLAADLAEIVQVAELLDCPPGSLEEEARSALLLDAATRSSAPYQSLLEHGCPIDPDPQRHDGLVDALNLCWQFQHDGGLDGIEYCAAVMQYLDLFWPADYKLYRCRYAGAQRLSPTAQPGLRNHCAEAFLEYDAWCAAVAELTAEVECCAAACEPLSRRGRALSRRLLCEDNEPLPSRDWAPPESLEKELL